MISNDGICHGVLEILSRTFHAEEYPSPKEEQAAHLALSALQRHEGKRILEENERTYRTLFESSPIAIVETDEMGSISYCNAAFDKLVESDTKWEVTGENAAEGRREIKQGRQTLLAESTPIEKSDGKPHLLTFLSDITEQKEKEEKAISSKEIAEAANKAKSEFLAVMSHEIRTPLNGVIGFSQILEAMPLGEKEKNYVSKIKQSGETLLATINDILNLSKIEAGKVDLETRAFNLKKTLEITKDILMPRAEEKGIYIDIVTKGVPRAIMGDETRIRQILLNLTGNAAKFTDKGGVTIRASYLAGIMTISVEDTGIGISEENQKKLFKPFSQADSSTTRKYGGTGLGLVICKKLVELMKGTIKLDSVAGEGSKFTITFPTSAGTLVEDEEIETDDEEDLLPLNVLVAEDDEVNRMVIEEMLRGFGHEVEFAKDGREAVKRATQLRDWADVILMDMRMPEMDGLEATSLIRKEEEGLGLTPKPIFALTANAMEEDKQKCLAAGMSSYLSKPIDVKILKKALGGVQAERRRHIQRELEEERAQTYGHTLSFEEETPEVESTTSPAVTETQKETPLSFEPEPQNKEPQKEESHSNKKPNLNKSPSSEPEEVVEGEKIAEETKELPEKESKEESEEESESEDDTKSEDDTTTEEESVVEESTEHHLPEKDKYEDDKETIVENTWEKPSGLDHEVNQEMEPEGHSEDHSEHHSEDHSEEEGQSEEETLPETDEDTKATKESTFVEETHLDPEVNHETNPEVDEYTEEEEGESPEGELEENPKEGLDEETKHQATSDHESHPHQNTEGEAEEENEHQIIDIKTLEGCLEYISLDKVKAKILPEMIANCRRAVETVESPESTAAAKREATHKMCGSLGTFGCVALEKLARGLENHYKTGDAHAPHEEELKPLVEETLTIFSELITKLEEEQ
jgi:signal transduction histidine kinase/DNA-binding response OmpR family regulator